MLFERRLREGVQDGSITLAFRRWKRAQVKAGGRYRMGEGLLAEVTSVEIVTDVTDEDARAAGFPDRAALLADLGRRGTDPIHRLALRLVDAPDPRDVLAATDHLTAEEVAALAARLERMGPWAERTLRLIAERPGVRAGDLAPEVGQDLTRFKLNVRKLKALGLTISLEAGYRLSPRGEAYLSTPKP
ncbi:hypothetical protein [Nonomuraea sp. SYSU D8015]|uniref:hypothetical protein n=1 Tax=Nonomuraea sp. SYSU D8015 TaxID=2593644 RepID=UPI001660B009|nr:hypothetical protein [Nonomuraea sp. SYSU D8015]